MSSIAAIIPAYKCKAQILSVIQNIGPEVSHIIVVDDACPEKTGQLAQSQSQDPRLKVLQLPKNRGVGGAVLAGMTEAMARGATIFVKVDGDGQMDPKLIPRFVAPILSETADYTKGNRFYKISFLNQMPALRLFGNSMLTLFCRLSSGYWSVSDPTNGFFAIHRSVFQNLDTEKISSRFFFESDLLFHLNIMKAVVFEIPMKAQYGDEKSNLKISRILLPFLWGHFRNSLKRIFYNYFLRSFSIGSLNLLFGSCFLAIGVYMGAVTWWQAKITSAPTPTGTIVLVALLVILGFQMLLGFLQEDMNAQPRVPFLKLWDKEL